VDSRRSKRFIDPFPLFLLQLHHPQVLRSGPPFSLPFSPSPPFLSFSPPLFFSLFSLPSRALALPSPSSSLLFNFPRARSLPSSSPPCPPSFSFLAPSSSPPICKHSSLCPFPALSRLVPSFRHKRRKKRRRQEKGKKKKEKPLLAKRTGKKKKREKEPHW
jgi:hypothetical protein